MVAPAGVGALLVVAQEVVDARQLAVAVEGAALIREAQVDHPAGPEDPLELQQPRDRVLQVLEQVVGDHEIE